MVLSWFKTVFRLFAEHPDVLIEDSSAGFSFARVQLSRQIQDELVSAVQQSGIRAFKPEFLPLSVFPAGS